MITTPSHASVDLLNICSKYIEKVMPVLKRHNYQFDTLYELLRDPNALNDESPLWNKKINTIYIQTLTLLGLSMHEGVLIPSIKKIKDLDGKITILWSIGVEDSFTMGIYDASFLKFVKFFSQKILNRKIYNNSISQKYILDIFKTLIDYQSIIEVLSLRLNKLYMYEKNIYPLFKNNSNTDLLFLIISHLPTEELNQFFLFLHAYFPDDLIFKMDSGNQVKIVSFFGNSSTNNYYLIDKVRVYYKLYHSQGLPIIQKITRTKTHDYLKNLLNKQQTSKQIMTSIKKMEKNQINTRKHFFMLFIENLQWLIPEAILE